MTKARGVMTKICTGVSYVGLVAVLFSMMVTTIDVILKLFTHTRILGASEMVEAAMVVMMYFGFGKTQLEEGHVRVDMFINKFPPKARCIINGIIMVIVTAVSVLITIQSFKQLLSYKVSGLGSTVIHIPFWILEIFMFVGLILLTLTFLLRAVEFFVETKNAKPIER